jgi:hypothetical protein
MSAKDVGLVIGGEPRIDFLPPEVKAGKQARKTRRSMGALVLLIVVVCAAGYVFATSLAVQAQIELASAQAETHRLIQQQGEFSEVRTVTGQLTSTANARLVGSANEVMWQAYLAQVVAVLPADTVLDGYTVTSQSATEPAPVSEIPLQGARIATVDFVALFPTLDRAEAVLKNLEALPGFADAWVTSVELMDDGTYTASFSLNVNSEVVERRFFAAPVETDAVTSDAETAATEGEG